MMHNFVTSLIDELTSKPSFNVFHIKWPRVCLRADRVASCNQTGEYIEINPFVQIVLLHGMRDLPL
jgi:hypothetical protein